jgi:hypothetical protein
MHEKCHYTHFPMAFTENENRVEFFFKSWGPFRIYVRKVKKYFYEGSLDSIPSTLYRVKIQILGGKALFSKVC